MSKTVVYIDGQNFMYSVTENLKNAGLISDKQEASSIDIPYLLKTILHVDALEDTEIRYYGVSKIKKQKDYGEYMLEKSIKFADNLRKLTNCLAKNGVKIYPSWFHFRLYSKPRSAIKNALSRENPEFLL